MRESSEEAAVIIFDTAAFLAGLHLLMRERIVTVEEVIAEVKDYYSSERLSYGMEADRIEVREAGAITVNREIPEALRRKLSETDLKLIQLALNEKRSGRRPIVFTDDYSVQKSLQILGIEFRPVRHRGIKEMRK